MFVVGLAPIFGALGAQHTRKVDLKGIRSHLGHNPVMALTMNVVNCLFSTNNAEKCVFIVTKLSFVN